MKSRAMSGAGYLFSLLYFLKFVIGDISPWTLNILCLMNLNDFIPFNPLTDSGRNIPERPGNYIVTIRDIDALPTLGHKIVTRHFNGQEIIYTGISKKNLYKRIWKSHIGGHAGRSTLRLTIGCLFGYTLIPRDKHDPNNGKVRFCPDDERELRTWMKENLVFYILPNDSPKELETELIEMFNPPLNLDECANPVNQEFRSNLTYLRGQRPWNK